jgi:hypothetical protein
MPMLRIAFGSAGILCHILRVFFHVVHIACETTLVKVRMTNVLSQDVLRTASVHTRATANQVISFFTPPSGERGLSVEVNQSGCELEIPKMLYTEDASFVFMALS